MPIVSSVLAPNAKVPKRIMSVMLLTQGILPDDKERLWRSFDTRFPQVAEHRWTNETNRLSPRLLRTHPKVPPLGIILDPFFTRFEARKALQHANPDYLFFTNDDLEVYHASQLDPFWEPFRDIIEEREAVRV